MDETKLDESTLAAQRQEMERLRRVQEQQRIIREVCKTFDIVHNLLLIVYFIIFRFKNKLQLIDKILKLKIVLCLCYKVVLLH
jgi:hypothetical protein